MLSSCEDQMSGRVHGTLGQGMPSTTSGRPSPALKKVRRAARTFLQVLGAAISSFRR